VIALDRGCRRHRAVLYDFVDRGAVGPSTRRALAHLDRCARCTDDLEAIVMTITALRRIGDQTRAVEAPPDAWPRLRNRLEGWRPRRPAVMSPIAGMAMSVALVAVIVAPAGLGGMRPIATPPPVGVIIIDRRIEAAYIVSVRQGTLPAAPVVTRGGGSVPRNYPDGIKPVRKEVGPVAPSGRPPDAI
jgi:anti-sigma factor RsiW